MITITNDEARSILAVLGPFAPEPCHQRGDHANHECEGYREAELARIYRVEERLRGALHRARRPLVITAHDGLTGRPGRPCSYCDSPDHRFIDCPEAAAFSRGELVR